MQDLNHAGLLVGSMARIFFGVMSAGVVYLSS
jgi:hypothetical protein